MQDRSRFFDSRRDSGEDVRQPETNGYPLHEGKSGTLVMHCSDPRFQEAFRMFLLKELGLEPGAYDPLIVPGASQVLTFADSLPKFASGLARPLKFLVKKHNLQRIVIIMHEDCAWYRDFVPVYVSVKGSVKDQQARDLFFAKHMLEEQFPGIVVKIFYASITPEKRVVFDRVARENE